MLYKSKAFKPQSYIPLSFGQIHPKGTYERCVFAVYLSIIVLAYIKTYTHKNQTHACDSCKCTVSMTRRAASWGSISALHKCGPASMELWMLNAYNCSTLIHLSIFFKILDSELE